MSEKCRDIIREEESIFSKNVIIPNGLTNEERQKCIQLNEMYIQGISYDAYDRIFKNSRDKINSRNVENDIRKKINLNFHSITIIKCDVCGLFQRGSYVFCSNCLDNGIKTRLLRSCKVDDCYANNKCGNSTFENMDKEILRKITCNHAYVVGNKLYTMLPTTHIITLLSMNMEDNLISTRKQLLNHINTCSANDSISGIMCHNNIPCFAALGEKELVYCLASKFERIESMENNTNCIIDFISCITNENSIEVQFYLKSIFTITNY